MKFNPNRTEPKGNQGRGTATEPQCQRKIGAGAKVMSQIQDQKGGHGQSTKRREPQTEATNASGPATPHKANAIGPEPEPEAHPLAWPQTRSGARIGEVSRVNW